MDKRGAGDHRTPGRSPLVFMLIGVLLFALESLQPTEQHRT
jgi:hypothetical protein